MSGVSGYFLIRWGSSADALPRCKYGRKTQCTGEIYCVWHSGSYINKHIAIFFFFSNPEIF